MYGENIFYLAAIGLVLSRLKLNQFGNCILERISRALNLKHPLRGLNRPAWNAIIFRVNNQRLVQTLDDLNKQGRIMRTAKGWISIKTLNVEPHDTLSLTV